MTQEERERVKSGVILIVVVAIAMLSVGVWLGIRHSKDVTEARQDEAIKVGGMVYKGYVYDIRVRPQESK